jgi:hypothetical protein
LVLLIIWGRTPPGQDKSRNIHSTSSGSGEIHSAEEEDADYGRDESVEIQDDAVVTEGSGENAEEVESSSGVDTRAVSEAIFYILKAPTAGPNAPFFGDVLTT